MLPVKYSRVPAGRMAPALEPGGELAVTMGTANPDTMGNLQGLESKSHQQRSALDAKHPNSCGAAANLLILPRSC